MKLLRGVSVQTNGARSMAPRYLTSTVSDLTSIALDAAGIETGPIFRPINKSGVVAPSRLSDRSVANIVKAYAEQAGLDPAVFSGHSLRAGFLTSAAGNGASIFKMMDVSRHKSVDTLRGYVRDAELFKDHAGAGLL